MWSSYLPKPALFSDICFSPIFGNVNTYVFSVSFPEATSESVYVCQKQSGKYTCVGCVFLGVSSVTSIPSRHKLWHRADRNPTYVKAKASVASESRLAYLEEIRH
jgi:hypothetical protein